MNIGLAFSGGGVRALIFHLGILKRLAKTKKLENITQISTVSGGSLAIALVYRYNNFKWPNSKQFLDKVLPKIKKILTTKNLQFYLVFLSAIRGYLLRPKGNILVKVLQDIWGIKISINSLNNSPAWWINSTCFETGVNWRFSQKSVGDYIYGRSTNTSAIQLSLAVASSAAFPGLIGPVKLKPDWGRKSVIHLWDGGVYDNLGMEALWKPNLGLQKNLDVLYVSDGGQKIKLRKRNFMTAWKRLIDIPISQVRALRSRIFIDYLIKNKQNGAYFQIGNTVEEIFIKANKNYTDKMIDGTMSKDDVKNVSEITTSLKIVAPKIFDMILQHGFEVANATLHSYQNKTYI